MSAERFIINMKNPINFVGKGDLVNWINQETKKDVPKVKTVEECRNGYAACYLLHKIYKDRLDLEKLYPGDDSLRDRLSKARKSLPDNINNFKRIKTLLDEEHLNYDLDIDAVAKGKFRDIYMFMLFVRYLYKNKFSKEENDNLESEVERVHEQEFVEGESSPQIRRVVAASKNRPEGGQKNRPVADYDYVGASTITKKTETIQDHGKKKIRTTIIETIVDKNAQYQSPDKKRQTEAFRSTVKDKEIKKKQNILAESNVRKGENKEDSAPYEYVRRVKIVNNLKQHNQVERTTRYENIEPDCNKIGLRTYAELQSENAELLQQIDELNRQCDNLSNDPKLYTYDIIQDKLMRIKKALPDEAKKSNSEFYGIYCIIHDINNESFLEEDEAIYGEDDLPIDYNENYGDNEEGYGEGETTNDHSGAWAEEQNDNMYQYDADNDIAQGDDPEEMYIN